MYIKWGNLWWSKVSSPKVSQTTRVVAMYNPFHPPPAPPGFGGEDILPEASASPLSKLVFGWLSPFLDVGYSRPLQKDDFWQLPDNKLTHSLASAVETNFYARCEPARRPAFLREPATEETTQFSEDGKDQEKAEAGVTDKNNGQKNPKYDASLLKALYKTFIWRWWFSGILKLISDTLNTTTPLINKALLAWLTDAYLFHNDPEATTKPKGIGYGIGLAVGVFVMQEASSLMKNHFMSVAMTTGLFLRTGIIGSVFRKSLRLSGRARLSHSVGQITTMISTDATRLDLVSAYVHYLWVSPIQIVIGVGLLIATLGYSALVGVGVILLGMPIQFLLVREMYSQRKKGVKITDTRVRLTTEVLQGIRLVKYYAWEQFYMHRITTLRGREVATIRRQAMARSLLISLVTFTPVLAAILSFITYSLSGHDLDVAIIFSSLQFFNIIRAPLLYFPLVLSNCSDAVVALGRISEFLLAEELDKPYILDVESKDAVSVEGNFTWETVQKLDVQEKHPASKKAGKKGADKGEKENVLPTTAPGGLGSKESDQETSTIEGDEKPFELTDLKFKVPKGAFVAIVGRVGSGKSSLLQALIGEMRRTSGHVVFGGSVAYVPQNPWIRNASLRDNVTFGLPDDEEKFRKIVHACSLDHDLEMLPHGEMTEIGEKGINLSGGQKARVSLARAAYSGSDVVLLDDSLSAVDAYVGKALLENCLLNGPLADRTRILVTHALHVLDKTDYIYVMDNGRIVEQGTYADLMADSVILSHLMKEFGNLEQEQDEPDHVKPDDTATAAQGKGEDKGKDQLMQSEERNTGAVTGATYSRYLKFAGGIFWAPVFLTLLTLTQGATVANNLFLGFWTAESIKQFDRGDYMAVYAALGIAQALFSFLLSFTFALVTLLASLSMFRAALRGVLYSPASFFDTTPIGRILSRLSKDQDTLDAEIANTIYQFSTTFATVLGTVALVFYTFPYLGIVFAPLSLLYLYVSSFYRRSSVETKRLDSIMRSVLYGSYSETLTGLSTIRAYRAQARSIDDADRGLDMENRAYYMTVLIQRWLAVRLDFFGNILVFGIALFAAGFRTSVSPSKIGVVLSYTLSMTQNFSDMVSQFARNEQNMNAVERILVYTDLPSEGDEVSPDTPPASWPDKGQIEFRDVQLAYRKGLPLVLKGVSFDVKPGEKIGIVGRTGAGKSSLLQALFRIVELEGGMIQIDGHDIRQMTLEVLRSRIALVPQDSTLFMGTLRDNIDPQGTRTDAELISALQRVWLLPKDGPIDPATEAKFSLDSTVGDDGANYSAGERQLLSLCRALVKNSRIIVLDEATSSVDVETDSKLQKTIQKEFANSTLLCIAHRLNTISYYDRILVMDAGQIAEFDTVLNLFDKEDSIFRSLCNEAGLSRQDILRIRAESAS
ncbi:hypothetical protein PLICRDRAFT_319144 [Plicaturopsis crispa FD-325 SS-3]|nr:hypothetical protein PLICRDRAFT_319144 [Plicaturopsis crispa FD-325 SS-3]